MIESELKKKIVNTISEYEKKCTLLQDEIDFLKEAINKLCSLSMTTNSRINNLFDTIRCEIMNKAESNVIQKSLDDLIAIMSVFKHKNQNNYEQIVSFIKHSTSVLSHVESFVTDRRAFIQIESLLSGETEQEVIFDNFIKLLSHSIETVVKQLSYHKKLLESQSNEADKQAIHLQVNPQINDSLLQLLNYLTIPEELDFKSKEVKSKLEKRLTPETLTCAIESLTGLVIEAVSIEKNRFKGFLKDITDQLVDFESYLKLSMDNSRMNQSDSLLLETELQENIAAIRDHMDHSKSIEELSDRVGSNLTLMGNRLKAFQEREKSRAREYEEQLLEMQTRLQSTEKNAEEMKRMIALQHFKVNHDSLTELPNRASYDDHIAESLHRFKRQFGALTIAVADIDHFKKINDGYGHLAGDKVLKKVATIFRSTIRTTDFVARYGGEEFVFIFESTLLEDAYLVLEKLRIIISDCQFCYHDNRVDVTISFGVTEAVTGDNTETLFARADSLLYKAKNTGRNRVER